MIRGAVIFLIGLFRSNWVRRVEARRIFCGPNAITERLDFRHSLRKLFRCWGACFVFPSSLSRFHFSPLVFWLILFDMR